MLQFGRDIELAMKERKFKLCERCSSEVTYLGSGKYQCTKCGHVVLDDFGKVKNYIEENGPAPAPVIAAATGVSMEIIGQMLKEGRVEIPEGSEYYVQCEKCGCDIRYGRFCPSCIKETASDIKRMLQADMGEKPKQPEGKGTKLHFADRRLR